MAKLGALDLLAIPRVPAVGGVWTWDGRAVSLLKHLHALTVERLASKGVALTHVPTLGAIRPAVDGYLVVNQFNAAFRVPPEWQTDQWLDPTPRPVSVFGGAAASFTLADPVSELEATAQQFAEQIAFSGAEAYGDPPLPKAVLAAARLGMFRLVANHDVVADEILMRFDALVGRRA